MTNHRHQQFLDTLFTCSLPVNELGKPVSSEAVSMVNSGWSAIGYLMVCPTLHPSDGHLMGVKRVAHDGASARELDQWFKTRVSEGYRPLFHYYLHTSNKQARLHADNMKGMVVHVKNHAEYGYAVIIECMLLAPTGFVEYATAAMDAARVAGEFASLVMMLKLGAKVLYTNSIPDEFMTTKAGQA